MLRAQSARAVWRWFWILWLSQDLLEIRYLFLLELATAHLFLHDQLCINCLPKRYQVVEVFREIVLLELLVIFGHLARTCHNGEIVWQYHHWKQGCVYDCWESRPDEPSRIRPRLIHVFFLDLPNAAKQCQSVHVYKENVWYDDRYSTGQITCKTLILSGYLYCSCLIDNLLFNFFHF